jgi:hypothetical protein
MDAKILNALLDGMFPMEESTKYFKSLIFGDPGVGKTALAGTFGHKVLHVEADPEGWQSLFNHPELVANNRMTRMPYQGVSQIEAIAQAYKEGIPGITKHDTVLIDTGSNIANLDLDVVTKKAIEAKGGIDRFDFDNDMWANYKQNAHRVRMAFLNLFMCPVNIIVTAHARDVQLKKAGIEMGIKTVPDFSPKILASINGMTSMIGYMSATAKDLDSAGNVIYERELQVHPTKTTIAKTRIGGLPLTINVSNLWSLRKIVDEWQATGGELLPEKDAPMELENDPEEIEVATGLEI